MKLILTYGIIFIVTVSIFTLIIFIKDKEIKTLKCDNKKLQNSYDELKSSWIGLNAEVKLEKKYSQKLAKKLSEISSMPIDDIMCEL